MFRLIWRTTKLSSPLSWYRIQRCYFRFNPIPSATWQLPLLCELFQFDFWFSNSSAANCLHSSCFLSVVGIFYWYLDPFRSSHTHAVSLSNRFCFHCTKFVSCMFLGEIARVFVTYRIDRIRTRLINDIFSWLNSERVCNVRTTKKRFDIASVVLVVS